MPDADDEKEIRLGRVVVRRSWGVPEGAPQGSGLSARQGQAGLEPNDWRPFDEVGAGCREIRIADVDGIFRVMYVAKFAEVVYVLHCFQKKTQATSKQHKDVAAARYRAVVNTKGVKR